MLTKDEVLQLAKKYYGITCGSIRQLPGYVDKNYYLQEENTGNEYVLRITVSENFHSLEVASAIDEVKEYMSQNCFQVNCLKQTKNGESRFQYVIDKEIVHVSLSTFLPGIPLHEIEFSVDQLHHFAREVGSLCGLVHNCLMKFSGDLFSKKYDFWSKTFVWYGSNVCKVKQYLPYVPDNDIKLIIEKILESVERFVLPDIPKLRQCFVHGDFSSTNLVLMKPKGNNDSSETSLKEKFGILDFEHCHEGPLVFEIAVCMAYMMTNVKIENCDKLKISKDVFAGYASQCLLTKAEENVLYWAVLARLSASYVVAHYRMAEQPENKEYIQIQARKCPKLIRLLWEKEKDATLKYWLDQ